MSNALYIGSPWPIAAAGDLRWVIVAVGALAAVLWGARTLGAKGGLSLKNTPSRRNVLNPVHILLAYLVSPCAYMAVAYLLKDWALANPHKAKVVFALVGAATMLTATLVIARMTFSRGLGKGLGLSMRHWAADTAGGLAGYLVIIPVCLGLLWLSNILLPPSQQQTHVMLEVARNLSPLWRALLAVLLAVLVPLAEELLFRGLIQSMLRRFLKSPWAAIIIASALFAAVHYPYYHTLAPLFALAVAMGYSYERTGRIYPAVLIHGIFNGVFLWLHLHQTA